MVARAHRFKVWICLLAASAAAPVFASDFDDMVNAERTFAADASVRGAREAFLRALASDGVVFAPGPSHGKTVWAFRPDGKDRLDWAPEAAEVAASGDLGYTCGPWRLTLEGDDRPSEFGHFLTLWKKQSDGNWKVLAHHIIIHSGFALPDKVVRRGALASGPAPTWSVGIGELREADRAAAGLVTAAMVSDDFLRLRDGRPPDSTAIGEAIGGGSGTRLDSGLAISVAGDLAATWGGSADGPSWLRIWRRPAAGDPPGLGWRLAVDLDRAALQPPG